jgi:hypothetical protein
MERPTLCVEKAVKQKKINKQRGEHADHNMLPSLSSVSFLTSIVLTWIGVAHAGVGDRKYYAFNPILSDV